MEASQCAEDGISEIVNIDLDIVVGLLVLALEDAEVATELVEGAELVEQLECHALAGGAALHRHLAERRRLVASEAED